VGFGAAGLDENPKIAARENRFCTLPAAIRVAALRRRGTDHAARSEYEGVTE
jgi:hypothetical protein